MEQLLNVLSNQNIQMAGHLSSLGHLSPLGAQEIQDEPYTLSFLNEIDYFAIRADITVALFVSSNPDHLSLVGSKLHVCPIIPHKDNEQEFLHLLLVLLSCHPGPKLQVISKQGGQFFGFPCPQLSLIPSFYPPFTLLTLTIFND